MRCFSILLFSLVPIFATGCADDDCVVRQPYVVVYGVTIRTQTSFASQRVQVRVQSDEGSAVARCTLPPAFACEAFQGAAFRAEVAALADGTVRVTVPERGRSVFTVDVVRDDGSLWGRAVVPAGFDRCGEAVDRGQDDLVLE
jgi:hypothetical protein